MTTTGARVQIRGLDELRRKLGDDLIAVPARNFLNRVGITVQSAARENAPTDRGLLRNSISSEVDSSAFPMWVRIGPNVGIYGAAQELGTRPFWPPKAPLEAWGKRKGLTMGQVYMVRRSIARKGIKPKRYLGSALDSSIPKITSLVTVMAAEIEARAGQQ